MLLVDCADARPAASDSWGSLHHPDKCAALMMHFFVCVCVSCVT